MTQSPDKQTRNNKFFHRIKYPLLGLAAYASIGFATVFPMIQVGASILEQCPDVSTSNGLTGLVAGTPAVYAGYGMITTGVIAYTVGAEDTGQVLLATGVYQIDKGLNIGTDVACPEN